MGPSDAASARAPARLRGTIEAEQGRVDEVGPLVAGRRGRSRGRRAGARGGRPGRGDGLADRHERVAVAARDQGRGGRSARRSRGGRGAAASRRRRRSPGRRRCQAPAPWTGSCCRARSRRPVRVVADDPRRIHQPARDARPRLALGRDPDDDQRPEPLRRPRRQPERGHRRPSRSRRGGRSRDRARRRRPATSSTSHVGAEPVARRPSGSGRGRARRGGGRVKAAGEDRDLRAGTCRARSRSRRGA